MPLVRIDVIVTGNSREDWSFGLGRAQFLAETSDAGPPWFRFVTTPDVSAAGG